ncbi:Fic family protein [Ancylomarina longa]|uniref:Fic family protein n=1 Tax=Ancylomarina longa TaxID=2487017 RepID=A0A434AUJ5_9BACT|nr:Fic family protein [Ancylomarina longa]RUT78016.1 Fic family protein [Ancylomarina longa]
MIEQPPKIKQTDSVIKLMIELQSNGLLKSIQDNYLYWDKLKYKAQQYDPVKLWSAVKFHRRINSSVVKFGENKFSFMLTDYIQRSLHSFDMHFGGTLSSNIGIAETDKKKFIISSLIEEAISSSQIEGANTTRKKAKEMIHKEQKPKSKDELMILNNFITMQEIAESKDEELTPKKILFIHRLISNNTLDNKEDEGRFRKDNDIFVVNTSSSETVHTPPNFEEIPRLIEDLCLFFNSDTDDFIHPIVKGCIIHFILAWIHPFADGNGRTSRALFYWYMLKKGYWMTEYLSISRIIKGSKNQYEKAFLYTESDGNDLSYFITYHIKTLEKAVEALKSYINRKQKEVSQASKFLKIPLVNDRMAQILKIIYDDADRVLNTKEIESRFSISNYTARTDLKNLVELGFLEIIKVNKKKQNFIKSSDFDKIIKGYNL